MLIKKVYTVNIFVLGFRLVQTKLNLFFIFVCLDLASERLAVLLGFRLVKTKLNLFF